MKMSKGIMERLTPAQYLRIQERKVQIRDAGKYAKKHFEEFRTSVLLEEIQILEKKLAAAKEVLSKRSGKEVWECKECPFICSRSADAILHVKKVHGVSEKGSGEYLRKIYR